jgi:outer membrane protein OmpA-like peptidoglycan-associated protein
MKSIRIITIALLLLSTTGMGCKSLNRTKKGAIIGTTGGAVIGAVIGRAAGNTALGALIGATVGGTTGVIIGRKMDKQAEELKNTIPGVKVYRVGEGIIVEFSDKILFNINKSDLNSGSKGSLDKLITVLNKYPDTDIEVQGHTDNTGTENYNMELSKKRAGTVSDYLNSGGVSSKRLTRKGYGELAPNYTNTTEEGRSQNRRVEFLITANKKMQEEAKKEAN